MVKVVPLSAFIAPPIPRFVPIALLLLNMLFDIVFLDAERNRAPPAPLFPVAVLLEKELLVIFSAPKAIAPPSA